MAIKSNFPIDLVADTHAEAEAAAPNLPENTTIFCKDEGYTMRVTGGVAVIISSAVAFVPPIVISSTQPVSPPENTIWIKPT